MVMEIEILPHNKQEATKVIVSNKIEVSALLRNDYTTLKCGVVIPLKKLSVIILIPQLN